MNIENLTPEQVQLIMSSGEDDPQFAEAANKQRVADQMRQQSMQKIEGRQMGRYYYPGTVGDAAAKIFQGYQGGQMQNQAQGMQREAQGRVVQGRQAYGNAMIEALRRKTAAGVQTPPQSMAGPGNDMDGFGVAPGGY